ncbi:MAG: polysaccharide biosynthesis protein, partial [Fusobacteriaceae bacterium]
EIIKIMRRNIELKVRKLPTAEELLSGKNHSEQLTNINIEDLIGKENIKINSKNIREDLEGKVILVTGSAGSIGSELIRQLSRFSPKLIIGIDKDENNLCFFESELKTYYKDLDFYFEICDVCDKSKVQNILKKYKPEIIFHTATYKQISLAEYNSEEVIKNNLFGTKNLVELADKNGAEKFVIISSDKAYKPSTIMGAIKRATEILIQEISTRSKTKFVIVRARNPFGSSGSVIKYFEKLISETRNLTLTHEDIAREFVTNDSVAKLTLEALSFAKGGETFVLSLGESVKIIELAKVMLLLSGSEVGIEISGLRVGERLPEDYMFDENKALKTKNTKIFIEKNLDSKDLKNIISELEKLEKNLGKEIEKEKLKEIFKEIVPNYKEIEDYKLDIAI